MGDTIKMSVDKENNAKAVDSTTLYFNEIGRQTGLLTAKEELELGRRVQAGDEAAKRRMVESHLRLVVRIVRKYHLHTKGIEFIDAISEGNFGLIRAVEKYNPDYGFRFSTYAVYWIKQSIERGIYNHSDTVRIPVHVRKELIAYKMALRELVKKLDHPPTDEEIADFLDRPVNDLRKMLNLAKTTYNSMDMPIDGSKNCFGDIMGDENEVRYEDTDLSKKIIELMDCLTEKEQQIICLRFGLKGRNALTLREVGAEVGLTRERVRQIQVTALKKLSIIAQERNIDCSLLSAA